MNNSFIYKKLNMYLKGNIVSFIQLDKDFELSVEYKNKDDFMYDLKNVLNLSNIQEEDFYDKNGTFTVKYSSLQFKKFFNN